MRLFVDFIPVVIWALLVIALIVVMLLASWVLRPHILQSSDKTSSYECGEEPIGTSRIGYPYTYVIYTVLFVIVDVLGAFLYLLSASTFRTDIVVVWQTVLFIVMIMAGIGYSLKMLPGTFLDGKETLNLYQQAKARFGGPDEESGGTR